MAKFLYLSAALRLRTFGYSDYCRDLAQCLPQAYEFISHQSVPLSTAHAAASSLGIVYR